MRRTIALWILSMPALCGAGQAFRFEPGETWVYKHEGPGLFAMERERFEGDKILTVESKRQTGGAGYWRLSQRYGETGNEETFIDISGDGSIVRMETGDAQTVTWNPPFPYLYPDYLEPGGSITLETVMTAGDGTVMPQTVTIERLPGETAEVPAGTFDHCALYRVVVNVDVSAGGQTLTMKTETQNWLHPSVNGSVKVVQTTEPLVVSGTVLMEGVRAVSELREYRKPSRGRN